LLVAVAASVREGLDILDRDESVTRHDSAGVRPEFVRRQGVGATHVLTSARVVGESGRNKRRRDRDYRDGHF
jgi:hypothetical protein